MIGSGIWNGQTKILNGAYMNFVSKSKSKIVTKKNTSPSVGYLWLMDVNRRLFKTADGMCLVVKK